MKNPDDKRVIIAAFIGNAAIAVMKFIVAFISGSAAMLAEAFHSTADSANQVLLMFGLKRSKRAPDDKHPFGYGKEVYFWGFVVAVSIFFVGGALSIYEGVDRIIHPHEIRSIVLPLTVLFIAIMFESYSWTVAMIEARKMRGAGKGGGGWRRISDFLDMAVTTRNPTVMIVLFEDTAALVSLVVAGLGISIAYYAGIPAFDAIASIIIGLILVGVAVFLARETKALLIGESATREDLEKIRGAVGAAAGVEKCGRLMTMHLGPDDILVNLEVDFTDALSTGELEAVIDRIEQDIKRAVPAVKRIFIEAESIKKKSVVQKKEE